MCQLGKGEIYTVQSLYNTPHFNMDLDITQSCCGSHIFLPWNFTKEWNGHFPLISL